MAMLRRKIDLIVSLHIILSVFVVLLNKTIYKYYDFPNISLTCLHFVVTTVCVCVCKHLGMFHRKSLSPIDVLRLAPSYCAFVVFVNLSLQTNTITTYQIFKMATTPTIVAIDAYVFHHRFPNGVLLSMVPILIGMILNAYSDFNLTVIGTGFATVAILATSIYQVMVRTKLPELQANSLQLLYYQAPISAVLLMCVVPVIEPPYGQHGTLTIWSHEVMAVVILSCLLALGVNLSMFWFSGSLSPLAYNVVGHAKVCLTVIGGVMAFNEDISRMQMCAAVLTFCGSVAFTVSMHRNYSRRPPTVHHKR